MPKLECALYLLISFDLIVQYYFTVGKDRACKSTTFRTKVTKRATGGMVDIFSITSPLHYVWTACNFLEAVNLVVSINNLFLFCRFTFKPSAFLSRKNLICKQHWCSYKRNLKRKIVSEGEHR